MNDNDAPGFMQRLFHALASALVGAIIWMSIVFWIDVGKAWQVGLTVMGVAFVGGFLYGKQFLEFSRELLKAVW